MFKVSVALLLLTALVGVLMVHMYNMKADQAKAGLERAELYDMVMRLEARK